MDTVFQSSAEEIKDILLCKSDDVTGNERCTRRERTIYGVAIYLALVIFLLLIIVIVLATTLSQKADDVSKYNVTIHVHK